MESPSAPRHYSSRESRKQLLQLPHQAHIEPSLAPISPILPIDPTDTFGLTTASAPKQSTAVQRIRGYSDPNAYGPPGQAYAAPDDADYFRRYEKRTTHRTTHRTPYVEDYSDEEEDPRAVVRRRASRQHRRPPVTFERHGPIPGRPSLDPRQASRFSEDESHTGAKGYQLYYDSDRDTPRKRLYAAAAAAAGGSGGRMPPRSPPSTTEVMRLPWTMWMNSNAKNHFVAFIGEFVGTTMFLFFAFAGTQVANIGSNAGADESNTTTGEATGFSPTVLLYISIVFGFSLMVNVWIFFRISGGLFNPAVTFAMLLCRAISPIRASLLLVAQVAGSIFSSWVVSELFPTTFNVRTTLSSGTSLVRGVFIEAVLTAELVFTIFMLAKEKHKATFIAPVGIGLALFIAELVGVYYTGGSLNPARSFGPCVVTGVFDVEHWIYWVGPGVGAIIAVVFYKFIKMLEYEVANPGQDDDDKDEEVKEKREKIGLEGNGMERV
ncbi:aquaporin-like protein [Didymella exigua CBS 183.55]|uniref:Aquaporin-like protein n=1 Tax=Didymella exigua CBS 183.55 TaxID=1150837 RepID=A0A6A5R7G4_9PLEO|nr:aquaporin-like protein [Didymella exigua CBS 183.55]KAF1922904.1 aquaporin-like protein [Didymella exigua CBS 183.55]